jgi:uncharacterized membrane protein
VDPVVWNLGDAVSVTQVILPGLAVSEDVVGIVTEHAERIWFVSIRTP